MTKRRRNRYDADVRATYCASKKDFPKISTSSHQSPTFEHKAIWDNVKMLLAGSELTKEDRESQLYDEFERFKMLPAVKLNKGLKETNHEQLYAYLKQHEKHAAQDRLIIERITPATNDQLAFVSTVQPHAQSSHVQSHQYPSSSTNPQSPQYPQFPETSQIDSGYTQTDELLDNLTKQMALLAQSFRATLPQTNNQLRTSSNTRNQATIQDGRVVVQNVQGRRYRIESKVFCLGEMVQQNGGNTFMQCDNHRFQDLALNEDNIFQADECDTFDSNVDDEPTAQSIFMANLSSVGSTNPQLIQILRQYDSELKKNFITRLTKKNSDADPIFDLEALVSQNKDLTAKLNALHDLNKCFRAENAKCNLQGHTKCRGKFDTTFSLSDQFCDSDLKLPSAETHTIGLSKLEGVDLSKEVVPPRTNPVMASSPESLKLWHFSMIYAVKILLEVRRTDNGTEFVNKDLTDFYESVGITTEDLPENYLSRNGVMNDEIEHL
ncbi:hypothetical protein Tco_0991102 [Tanacetum coccineum]|uniref:Integrase catalytic domain-containing protein n=1 Tax=Tanacetum coccineum TaxID=301880 RepID=A0ABQ5EZ27_9ASTR